MLCTIIGLWTVLSFAQDKSSAVWEDSLASVAPDMLNGKMTLFDMQPTTNSGQS